MALYFQKINSYIFLFKIQNNIFKKNFSKLWRHVMKTKKDIKNKQLDYLMKRGIKNDKGQLENIENANDLAIKILENEKCREILKISDSDMDTEIDINGNIRYEKTLGNTAKSINNHLHHPDSMSQKYIKAYCIIFDCSADYLLGFIDLPTKEKTDFNKLTGLWDNCMDTLAECNKHEAYDNSWADYNKNIINVLNYLLYCEKDNLINHKKITLLNDIFNYFMFSDFHSYTDNDGIEQGSHITFTDENGLHLCSLPATNMYNAIKLNINSVLDDLRQHMKQSGFYIIRKPELKDCLNEIKENQHKIEGYNNELKEILKGHNSLEREGYIGTLERCKGICFERIHQEKQIIVKNYKDLLKQKDFSNFQKWQQIILETVYKENELYITDKL